MHSSQHHSQEHRKGYEFKDSRSLSDVLTAIRKQIEYYLGDHNLPTDSYTNKILSANNGWLSLPELLMFNRIKRLTRDPEIVTNAIKESKYLELDESDASQPRLRRRWAIGKGPRFGMPEETKVPFGMTEEGHKNWEERRKAQREEALGKRTREDEEDNEARKKAKTDLSDKVDGLGSTTISMPASTALPPNYHQHHTNIFHALKIFHDLHFGPAARHAFFQVPYTPSNNHDQHQYHSTNTDGNYNHDAVHEQYGTEEVVEEAPEYESNLTPEMIEIFKHSEKWRKEKAQLRAKAEQQATQQEQQHECTATAYKTKESLYGSEGAYRVWMLETVLDERFERQVEERKAVLWPIVPLRWK